MRLAFISDIHGNAVALESVLNDIRKKNVDNIFVLGDLCYRGPEPKRSLELIKDLGGTIIKGNADEWVIRGVQEGEVPDSVLEVMNKERDWTVSNLNPEDIEYLSGLQSELHIEYGGTHVHAFHATPNSLFDVVKPFENDESMKRKLMVNDADIFVYAHIHMPFIRYINGKCIVNLGSVGLPFDGLRKASYVILDIEEEGYQVSSVRVDYDYSKVIKQIENSDYPNKEFLSKLIYNAKI
ncbi:metallophosphoesterase family protein [Bacillus timonensis]|uniref:metallophosphoesterase family protein n=1 Tax=Bacillus timonensis TaxID=1033734 RepID=UPI000289E064|nr:YfcE family phosphodiesterase [Bacillus timonensis]